LKSSHENAFSEITWRKTLPKAYCKERKALSKRQEESQLRLIDFYSSPFREEESRRRLLRKDLHIQEVLKYGYIYRKKDFLVLLDSQ